MTIDNHSPKMGTGAMASAAALVAALFVMFLSLFVLGQPYGQQMFLACNYTSFFIVGVFFDTRGYRGYPLWQKYVQRTLPTIALIHVGFLGGVTAGQTYLMRIRPSLPASFIQEHGPKHESNFEWVCLIALTVTLFTEMYVCRKLLAKASEEARLSHGIN